MQTPYTKQRKQKKLLHQPQRSASTTSLDSIDVEKQAQIYAHRRAQSSVKSKLTRFARSVSRRRGVLNRKGLAMRGRPRGNMYGVYTCGDKGTVVFVPGIAGGGITKTLPRYGYSRDHRLM